MKLGILHEKLEINDDIRVVAGFLNTYGTWSDGLPETAADYWDGVVKLCARDGEIKEAIINLERSLKGSDSSDDIKKLELNGNTNSYLDMLSHMRNYV